MWRWQSHSLHPFQYQLLSDKHPDYISMFHSNDAREMHGYIVKCFQNSRRSPVEALVLLHRFFGTLLVEDHLSLIIAISLGTPCFRHSYPVYFTRLFVSNRNVLQTQAFSDKIQLLFQRNIGLNFIIPDFFITTLCSKYPRIIAIIFFPVCRNVTIRIHHRILIGLCPINEVLTLEPCPGALRFFNEPDTPTFKE